MNSKVEQSLIELIEYEKSSVIRNQSGVLIKENWKLRTIKRLINYQYNEDEAYCEGFKNVLVDYIIYDKNHEDNLLECIDYVSQYEKESNEMKIFVWNDHNTLSSWTNGQIICIAKNLNDALHTIDQTDSRTKDEFPSQTPNEVINLNNTESKAWIIWGGE